MSLPYVSLNAVTSTGAGNARDLETVQANHTLIMSATGSPSGFVVRLEGSHDGSTWLDLGAATEETLAVTVNTHLVRYVRARLASVTGGSSPTVTATIASR